MKRIEYRRVFQKIPPQWDYDLHVHSNWSQDTLDGPSMEEFAKYAQRYKIHIGFADHFEFAFYDEENTKYGKWKLNPDSIHQYLEEIDNLKEQYSFISSGLEIEYYPYKEEQLQDFMDDYKNQFDHLIGSAHELEPYRAITDKNDFKWLLTKHKSFDNIVRLYFQKINHLIRSTLFDTLAHPDVVFRFLSESDPNYKDTFRNYYYLNEVGYLCKANHTSIEINTSGHFYPWKQSFPSEEILHHFIAHEIPVTIGSDSHNINQFEKSITNIRKINRIVRNEWKFSKTL